MTDTTPHTKPYKEHLRERIATTEDIVGYLSACYGEGPGVFQLAVKDVLEFARTPSLRAQLTASQESVVTLLRENATPVDNARLVAGLTAQLNARDDAEYVRGYEAGRGQAQGVAHEEMQSQLDETSDIEKGFMVALRIERRISELLPTESLPPAQPEGECVVTSDGKHRTSEAANGTFCDFCGIPVPAQPPEAQSKPEGEL